MKKQAIKAEKKRKAQVRADAKEEKRRLKAKKAEDDLKAKDEATKRKEEKAKETQENRKDDDKKGHADNDLLGDWMKKMAGQNAGGIDWAKIASEAGAQANPSAVKSICSVSSPEFVKIVELLN